MSAAPQELRPRITVAEVVGRLQRDVHPRTTGRGEGRLRLSSGRVVHWVAALDGSLAVVYARLDDAGWQRLEATRGQHGALRRWAWTCPAASRCRGWARTLYWPDNGQGLPACRRCRRVYPAGHGTQYGAQVRRLRRLVRAGDYDAVGRVIMSGGRLAVQARVALELEGVAPRALVPSPQVVEVECRQHRPV